MTNGGGGEELLFTFGMVFEYESTDSETWTAFQTKTLRVNRFDNFLALVLGSTKPIPEVLDLSLIWDLFFDTGFSASNSHGSLDHLQI